MTVLQGTLLQFIASAADPNQNDVLTFSLDTAELPGNPQIDPATGVFSWVPTVSDGPGFQVTVRVTDQDGLSDTESFIVFVTASNSSNTPPVLDPIGILSANVAAQLTFTASATDTDEPADTLSFFLDPQAPNGALINSSTGVFTWTPTAQGKFSFLVIVSDGTADAVQTVTVNVGAAVQNFAPTITQIDNQVAVINTELRLRIQATDPNANDTLTYSLVTTGLPGNPQIDPTNGVFAWTPTQLAPGFNVTVQVQDQAGLKDTATFTVTVNADGPGNQAPVLNQIPNQQATVGSRLTVTVTATDGDVPADTLTFFILPTAPNGASIDRQTGVLTWTPVTNDVGTVTFPIFVDDGSVIVSQTVTIVVTTPGGGGDGPGDGPGPGQGPGGGR
ncbi:MAG TPA: hypothetical protein EYQ63_07350 [Fuerstia sp.]|nr:hypothetical protein [Fuerstiella sp.]